VKNSRSERIQPAPAEGRRLHRVRGRNHSGKRGSGQTRHIDAPLHLALRELRHDGYRLTWTCYVEEHDGDAAISLSAAILNDLGTLPIDLWVDTFADAEPA